MTLTPKQNCMQRTSRIFLTAFLPLISVFAISNTAWANFMSTAYYVAYHNGGGNVSDYEYFLTKPEALARQVEIINSERRPYTQAEVDMCMASTDWVLTSVEMTADYISDNPFGYMEADTIPCQGTNWLSYKHGTNINTVAYHVCPEDMGVRHFISVGVRSCVITYKQHVQRFPRWFCTPKCGESYYMNKSDTPPSMRDPGTKCQCIQSLPNPKFDKPLPGFEYR